MSGASAAVILAACSVIGAAGSRNIVRDELIADPNVTEAAEANTEDEPISSTLGWMDYCKLTTGFLVLLALLALLQLASIKLKNLPCCRSIPWMAIAYFQLSFVGVALSFAAQSEIKQAMIATGNENLADRVSSTWICSFNFLLLVNLATLVVSFMGAGCFRECIFGRGDRNQGSTETLSSTRKFLMGPMCLAIIRTLLWLTLWTQLIVSYLFLEAGIVLLFFSSACKAGNEAIKDMQEILDHIMPGKVDFAPVCKVLHGFSSAATMLFIGSAVTVISQAGLLSTTAAEKVRIELELEKNSEEKPKEISKDEPSTSTEVVNDQDDLPQQQPKAASEQD